MTLKILTASALGLAVSFAAVAAQAHPARHAAQGNGIWIASGDVNGDGRPDGRALEQNGTTVATAGDVQAPNTTERPHLLLPAVQKAQAEPAQKGMAQNGTTVPSASDVAAPGGEGAALLLPAVQKAQAQPKRAELKQNGTTVATAGEVAAPAAE